MVFYVATGPSGCGESTWVRTTTQPGDIRFDSDDMINLPAGKVMVKHHYDNLPPRSASTPHSMDDTLKNETQGCRGESLSDNGGLQGEVSILFRLAHQRLSIGLGG